MTLEQWQTALRQQYGRKQQFELENIGSEKFFSEFIVTNPETGGEYRVAIRGAAPGDNYCSCPDFAVNTLGTCKHIAFTIAQLEKKRGSKKAFREGYHPEFSEVYLRYGAQRQVMFRVGSACPDSLKWDAGRYFDGNNILTTEGIEQFEQFVKRTHASKHEVRLYEDAMRYIARVRDRSALEKRIANLFRPGTRSVKFKKLLKTDLYPYQRAGILFAARAGRSVIADDMGLGKTVQAIGAAEVLAQTAGVERVLIISPTSLKHQWNNEIKKFSGRPSMVIEGLYPARTGLYEENSFFKITNYDVIHRDLELIKSWSPDLIILDEAQRIKNWRTRTAQSVKNLESEYALVLTGTPLENRLEELHSIIEFVDRWRLGPLFRFLHTHQHTDETGRVIGYRDLASIGKTLAPILIRRTRDEVLKELPERLEKNFLVPMTPEQNEHHQENQKIVAQIVSRWRRTGYLSESNQRRLTCCLQNMRMACNSTYLLDQKSDHGVKADELMTLIEEMMEDSGKKIVIFSQWVRTHDILRKRLSGRKWGHVLFTGSVPSRKRKDLVSQFKDDPYCRLFLSTDAGGLGLNLQNADTVINMDLPWNPAVLEQRIGRVHRLGQHKPVRVVNFVSHGTIEHGMLDVLSFKSSLFAGVLDGGKDEIFLGETKLKKFMESVDKVTKAVPPAMPATEPARDDTEVKTERKSGTGEEKPAYGADPWADLAAAGVDFLEKLSAAMSSKNSREEEKKGGSFIQRDERTGQSYIRIPVPGDDVIENIKDVLNTLAERGNG